MSGLEDKGGSGQGEMGSKGIEGGSRRDALWGRVKDERVILCKSNSGQIVVK